MKPIENRERVMILTLEQIREIHNRATNKVRICCDEFHAHSALNGCITGDLDAVVICKLCETIGVLRGQMAKMLAIIQEKR